jgi:hypothetical protein
MQEDPRGAGSKYSDGESFELLDEDVYADVGLGGGATGMRLGDRALGDKLGLYGSKSSRRRRTCLDAMYRFSGEEFRELVESAISSIEGPGRGILSSLLQVSDRWLMFVLEYLSSMILMVFWKGCLVFAQRRYQSVLCICWRGFIHMLHLTVRR